MKVNVRGALQGLEMSFFSTIIENKGGGDGH